VLVRSAGGGAGLLCKRLHPVLPLFRLYQARVPALDASPLPRSSSDQDITYCSGRRSLDLACWSRGMTSWNFERVCLGWS